MTEPDAPEVPPRASRADLLRAARAKSATLDFHVDPLEIVGDLATATPQDIDELAEVMRSDDQEAEALQERADGLMARAKKHMARSASIRAAIEQSLKTSGRDQVAGSEVKFRLKLSPWKVVIDDTRKVPTAADHLEFGELVKRTDPTFRWDLVALAKQLKNGFTCAFARLDRGRHMEITEVGGKPG